MSSSPQKDVPPQSTASTESTPPAGTTPPASVNTQAAGNYWKRLTKPFPVWVQFLPMPLFRPLKPQIDDPLIDLNKMTAVYDELIKDAKTAEEKAAYAAAFQRVQDDIEFMKHNLLRLQRVRDHDAKKNQNNYRLYQILFLGLAAVAAALGSLQALSLSSGDRQQLAIFAFLETLVALAAVFLATISGREPPLPRWLDSRRKAEQLRREYFRFLLNMAPYEDNNDVKRRMSLSERAANINRGVYPDESGLI